MSELKQPLLSKQDLPDSGQVPPESHPPGFESPEVAGEGKNPESESQGGAEKEQPGFESQGGADGNTPPSKDSNEIDFYDNQVNEFTEQEDVPIVKDPTSNVTCVCSCAKGVMVGLSDGAVILVGPQSETLLGKHELSVSALSAFGDVVVSGSDDTTLKIWNLVTKKVRIIKGHTDSVTCVSVLPGGNYVISGSKDNTVRAWSVKDGSTAAVLEGHGGPVKFLSFIREGKIIISGSEDKTVKLWYCYSWSLANLFLTLKDPTKKPGDSTTSNYEVTCVSAIPGKDLIISGLRDGTAKIWRYSDPSGLGLNINLYEVAELKCGEESVTCLAATVDGKFLFSGSEDGLVRMYELDYLYEGEVIILRGHTAKVNCLLVFSDGKHVVSGSDDHTMRVWSIEETKEIVVISGKTKEVKCIAAMPGNKHIVLGSTDGTTILTDLREKNSAFCDLDQFDQAIDRAGEFFEKHEEELKEGKTISPQYVNILHKCAYQKEADDLKNYLDKDIPIIRGVFGSPLTLALLKKSTKCVDTILEHLTSIENKERLFTAIQAITEDFPQLLVFNNLHHLIPFFNTLITAPNQKVPEAIVPQSDFPITLYSIRRSFHLSSFENPKGGDEEEEVQFWVSLFRWNFKQGSDEFLKLLRALEECDDRKVLTTPVVSNLVQSRWETLLVPARLHTVTYLYLLLCLIGIIFNYWNVGVLVEVIFLILNVIFLIFKIVESVVKKEEYWTNVWFYVSMFGCITSIASMVQYNAEPDSLFVMAGMCFARGINTYRLLVGRFIKNTNNYLYLCSLLYLIGMAFNYWNLGILGIIIICLNALLLGFNALLNYSYYYTVWNHGKVLGCLASIAWGGLVLYEAENLRFLHFVMVCMCSFCFVSFFHQNHGFIVLYICLILCVTEMTFNYWSLGVLGLIFICLNTFFFLANFNDYVLNESSYLSNVWNYVDGFQCLVGTIWGFLVYIEAGQSVYSHFVVICMLSLYILTIPISSYQASRGLLYLCSIACLIGVILNYWSLGILEIVYIGLNVAFLIYEMTKIAETNHWRDVWTYVNVIQCLMSITWGWLVFFELENLQNFTSFTSRWLLFFELESVQYIHVAVVFMSLLRGLEVFKYSEMPLRRYICLVLYICLLLCLVEMTLNPNLGILGVIFLYLIALLLICEIVEICKTGTAYWTDVWNYVTLLQCITSSTWGCLLYYGVEHLQYLHLVVLTLCFLRSFTFFHHLNISADDTTLYLFYLSSILYMIEITFNNWSLWIIFIGFNALFLLYEIVKSIRDLKTYWRDVWNYVHAVICLIGVAWGLLTYFEVDQLQYLHVLLVSVISLRILSFFPDFKMTGYNLLYLSSLLCLAGITINYWNITLLEISFICLNVLFLLYEFVQCLATGTDYLLDVWNYVDLTRCVTSIVWGWLRYNDVENLRYLDFAVVALCFLRGFTFFRTFKMTRMFVRMVLEVVKDMYSFLVILAFSTCSFGMMYAVLVPDEITGAPGAWTNAYSLLMGNFSSDKFGGIEWFCFTAASLVNVIIMLNLLISILGKAYEKAEESMKENDTLEMLRLVIEYESMLFWKRKDRESTVMIVCKAAEPDAEDEWTEKITGIDKVMKDNLTALETKQETKLDLKLKAIEDKLDAKMETVEAKMNTVETKLDQILAELRAQHK